MLPREAVRSPSLEVFRTRLGTVLSTLVGVLWVRAWTRDHQSPSNVNYSVAVSTDIFMQSHGPDQKG